MTKTQINVSLKYWRNRLARAGRGLKRNPKAGDKHQFWLSRQWKAKEVIARREKQLTALKPVRLRAHDEAVKLIGVMERGGNNAGPMVSKIIKTAGGSGPEPWCGDTMYYCYHLAGSKTINSTVARKMAYVPWISTITGVKVTQKPVLGNIVRFEFTGDSTPDHTGMFEKDNGNGTITTIEGNTGSSGAVSDSSTGGDGVYRKIRSKSLVRDYVHVSR